MVELAVKWGKESFPISLTPQTGNGYDQLTSLLQEKTNVPVDRMKIMAKSKGLWKGVLKPDTVVDWDKAVQLNNNSSNNSSNGAAAPQPLNVLLMGSAAKLAAPTQKTVFLEDLPPEEIAKVVEPAGLSNLGNTCYLNSVVQCLRAIPPLRQGIAANESNNTNSNSNNNNPVHRVLIQALQRTLEQLDRQTEALSPFPLVQATKMTFPQFASTGPHGQPQQQDAEEFYSAVLNVVATQMPLSPAVVQAALPETTERQLMGAANLVDAIFGLQLKETLVCDEVPDGKEPPVVSYDLHRKLVCNIQGGGAAASSSASSSTITNVTHVAEGIMLALQEKNIEKHSTVLNRNASWTRTQRVARLPPIVTIQFGRFYWKATPDSQDHAGVKCKIMKPVTFQSTLDMYEFCTPEVQAVLGKARKAAAQAEEDRVAKKLKGMDDEKNDNDKKKEEGSEAKQAKTSKDESAMETDATAAGGGEDDEDAAALQAALAMSMDTEKEDGNNDDDDAPIGPGLPKDFQGIYELFAVVTHKGRDADGGHYMAWVKAAQQPKAMTKIGDTNQDNEDWFVYDDDEVSPCKTEDILKLKGGGDWHMSYLNFYRAKK